MIRILPLSLFFVIAILIIPFIVKAENEQENKGVIIAPFTGYRYDIYQFSIRAGTSATDKKVSELTWKNHISGTGIKIQTVPEENELNLLGQIKYGYILNKSKNQDSDWDDIGEFSRSFSSVKGDVFDLSGALGFSKFLANSLITYYVGMDYTRYQMKDYGLYYTIQRLYNENENDSLGQTHSKNKLVNKYTFDNYAPWLGVSVNYPISEKISFIPTLKLYSFYLSSQAKWLLRDDLQQNPSFTKKALGFGMSFDSELLYKYNNNLDFNVNIGIKKLTTLQGKNKEFLVNGESFSRDLKMLSFLSSSISCGIKYKL